MSQYQHIKELMEESARRGITRIDIGVPSLGESTLITIKEKDFRAEFVTIVRGEVMIEGYNEKCSPKTIRLENVDTNTLPELSWSIESAIQNQIDDFYFLEQREGITDSLLLDSGQEVLHGVYQGVDVSVIVHGSVRIVWKDEAYKNVSQFPAELVELIRSGEYRYHPDVYVDDCNWYELVVKDVEGKEIFFQLADLDLSVMTDTDARDYIIREAKEGMKRTTIIARKDDVEAADKEIHELTSKIRAAFLNAIKANISGMGRVDLRMLFRFIDADRCQDITRVKCVYLNDNDEIEYIADSFNGEVFASDTCFDDDRAFSDEVIVNLSKGLIEPDIHFLEELYEAVKSKLAY